MKRKGFTLIELLGSIVVLAIIAIIVIPITLNIVNKVRLNALKDSAYDYLKQVIYIMHSIKMFKQ